MSRDILVYRGLYFVTDRGLSRKSVVEDVTSAISAGVKIVQYREKEFGFDEQVGEARELRRVTKEKGVLLIINDDVEIALEVEADGVHIGQDDTSYAEARKVLGSGKIIGVTVHNVSEAVLAEKMGADYLGVSPIFDTTTKLDAGKGSGVELIQRVKKAVRLPIIAIGGINYNNLEEVMGAGADGAVAMSAIIAKDDVSAECKKFIEMMQNDNTWKS